ncbi:MAG: AraC family transcriptional regulator [Liquorilactobacillus nagelii]|nr:AraC family transcriptional regulator [Liquorilactobacillus nagelii]
MIKKNSETELKVYSIQKEDEDSTKNLFKNEYFRGAFFEYTVNKRDSCKKINIINQLSPKTKIYVFSNKITDELVSLLEYRKINKIILMPLSYQDVKQVITELSDSKNIDVDPTVIKLRRLIINQQFKKTYSELLAICSKLKDQISSENISDELDKIGQLILKSDENSKKLKFFSDFDLDLLEHKSSDPIIEFFIFELMDIFYQNKLIQKKPIFVDVFKYINQNIESDLYLSNVASQSNISASYLSREISNEFGFSFNKYIQVKKVEDAKKKFYFDGEKVIDVSFKLSFSEPSYFSKIFKKIQGETPIQYKKSILLDKEKAGSKK